jgi:hypothetical protein
VRVVLSPKTSWVSNFGRNAFGPFQCSGVADRECKGRETGSTTSECQLNSHVVTPNRNTMVVEIASTKNWALFDNVLTKDVKDTHAIVISSTSMGTGQFGYLP